MAYRWKAVAIALLAGLAPGSGFAQSDRGWVDPPAAEPRPQAPPQAAPAPAPPPPPAPAPRRVETEPLAPAPPAATAAPRSLEPPAPTQSARPQRSQPIEGEPEPEPETEIVTRPEPGRREPSPDLLAPPARAPRPAPREPAVAERPEPERPAANLGRAAQQLTLDYLDFWSASNAETLDVMPEFYGSRVEFHGRLVSARSVFEEKRRFVRRWPERQYSPRRDTMRVSCAPAGEVCTVRTQFDFVAANPQRGQRSTGTGQLELVVALAGSAPVIVSETSQVMKRGRLVPAESDEED